jgi:hypothetical protein
MSWHCLICGESDSVTGLMFLYDIKGGIPLRYCLHLRCLVEMLIQNDKTDMTEFQEEVLSLEKEDS